MPLDWGPLVTSTRNLADIVAQRNQGKQALTENILAILGRRKERKQEKLRYGPPTVNKRGKIIGGWEELREKARITAQTEADIGKEKELYPFKLEQEAKYVNELFSDPEKRKSQEWYSMQEKYPWITEIPEDASSTERMEIIKDFLNASSAQWKYAPPGEEEEPEYISLGEARAQVMQSLTSQEEFLKTLYTTDLNTGSMILNPDSMGFIEKLYGNAKYWSQAKKDGTYNRKIEEALKTFLWDNYADQINNYIDDLSARKQIAPGTVSILRQSFQKEFNVSIGEEEPPEGEPLPKETYQPPSEETRIPLARGGEFTSGEYATPANSLEKGEAITFPPPDWKTTDEEKVFLQDLQSIINNYQSLAGEYSGMGREDVTWLGKPKTTEAEYAKSAFDVVNAAKTLARDIMEHRDITYYSELGKKQKKIRVNKDIGTMTLEEFIKMFKGGNLSYQRHEESNEAY